MKNKLFVLIIASSSLLLSCDNKEEEPPFDKNIRVSSLSSVDNLQKYNFFQTFEYNKDGLISNWELSDNGSIIKSSFDYQDNTILISSTEPNWHFDEKLYLNTDGTAKHAEGKAKYYYSYNPEQIVLIKNYTSDFQYNSLNQLTKITISEKRTDDNGWEESNSLDWCVELTWKDNDLIEYIEYSNPSRPLITLTYSYYDGYSPEYKPIMQCLTMRHYHLPLQYQGVFGMQSGSLVKTRIISRPQSQDYVTDYSYDFSISIHDSRVENYYEKCNGKEFKYAVKWDVE